MNFSTADLCDTHEHEVQVCEPLFADYGGHRSFRGAIRTLKCFEDNSLVREALAQAGNGAVLVVDAGGSRRCAMLGDQLAELAVNNGWAGILMYGMIRDSEAIARLPLGVKALGTMPLKSVKRGEGRPDILLRFAGASFAPGDWLYADADGIVVSRRSLIPAG